MIFRKGRMAQACRLTLVYTAGGLLYAALEILFRGRTHWSMMITGGLCVVLLYEIAVKSREKLWRKWVMGGAVITTIEFLSGIVVNILLGWHVWDYSKQWANLFGQICLSFFLLWIALSIPGIWLMKLVSRHVFRDKA